jgi:hypothetical protein
MAFTPATQNLLKLIVEWTDNIAPDANNRTTQFIAGNLDGDQLIDADRHALQNGTLLQKVNHLLKHLNANGMDDANYINRWVNNGEQRTGLTLPLQNNAQNNENELAINKALYKSFLKLSENEPLLLKTTKFGINPDNPTDAPLDLNSPDLTLEQLYLAAKNKIRTVTTKAHIHAISQEIALKNSSKIKFKDQQAEFTRNQQFNFNGNNIDYTDANGKICVHADGNNIISERTLARIHRRNGELATRFGNINHLQFERYNQATEQWAEINRNQLPCIPQKVRDNLFKILRHYYDNATPNKKQIFDKLFLASNNENTEIAENQNIRASFTPEYLKSVVKFLNPNIKLNLANDAFNGLQYDTRAAVPAGTNPDANNCKEIKVNPALVELQNTLLQSQRRTQIFSNKLKMLRRVTETVEKAKKLEIKLKTDPDKEQKTRENILCTELPRITCNNDHPNRPFKKYHVWVKGLEGTEVRLQRAGANDNAANRFDNPTIPKEMAQSVVKVECELNNKPLKKGAPNTETAAVENAGKMEYHPQEHKIFYTPPTENAQNVNDPFKYANETDLTDIIEYMRTAGYHTIDLRGSEILKNNNGNKEIHVQKYNLDMKIPLKFLIKAIAEAYQMKVLGISEPYPQNILNNINAYKEAIRPRGENGVGQFDVLNPLQPAPRMQNV